MKKLAAALMLAALTGCQSPLHERVNERLDHVREQGMAAFDAGCENALSAGEFYRDALRARHVADYPMAWELVTQAKEELSHCD